MLRDVNRTRWMERVVVRNCKPFRDLELALRQAPPDALGSAPWLMLIGENGIGKSSLLQAIALALVGPRARERLGLDASVFVRSGARSGRVEVYLSDAHSPSVVGFSRGSPYFEGESEPDTLVLGFGPTRLLPSESHPSQRAEGPARVENLRPLQTGRNHVGVPPRPRSRTVRRDR